MFFTSVAVKNDRKSQKRAKFSLSGTVRKGINIKDLETNANPTFDKSGTKVEKLKFPFFLFFLVATVETRLKVMTNKKGPEMFPILLYSGFAHGKLNYGPCVLN
jgi:hypothetical protein